MKKKCAVCGDKAVATVRVYGVATMNLCKTCKKLWDARKVRRAS